jgi:hypothetical protein
MVVQVLKIEHLTREVADAKTNSSADSSGIYIGVAALRLSIHHKQI